MYESDVAATLIDLLQLRAASDAATCGYAYYADDGNRLTLPVDALERRARAIGAALQRVSRPGDRALLAYPPGLEFISAFFGCVFAGVLPVPATYPKPRRLTPRLSAIAADCQATLTLTNAQTLETLGQAKTSPELAALDWIATDRVPDSSAADWRRPETGADDLAFLQYTSGSTSQPKGVAVTHRNLMHNLETIRQGFDIPGSYAAGIRPIGVSWLPSYHDMGLIGGVFNSLYSGFQTVLISPASFLQRPLNWLRAITVERGTIIGAPNFAYDLCVAHTTAEERATLDLSSVRLSLCAAEPIRAETLSRFANTFADCGFRGDVFYPCYGLAESTLLAAGPPGPVRPKAKTVSRMGLAKYEAVSAVGDGPQVQKLVGCGNGLIGQEIAIVDPESQRRLPDDTVGEIWIAGPSVAQGYWNRADDTEAVFRAKITDELGPPHLRSGDLGFLSDGELYVTGRLKDVIIIRGRNHYPHDIELTAWDAHVALLPDCGAAFAVEADGQEGLVVVQEIDRHHRSDDLSSVFRDIRLAVIAEHELDPRAIVLIRQASVPRTTSGKIQRSLCRAHFLEGTLNVIAQWSVENQCVDDSGQLLRLRFDPETDRIAIPRDGLTAGDIDRLAERIEARLLEWLVARSDLPSGDVDRQRPFAEYGVDSLAAVELSADLERWLQVPTPAIAAWNYPTPESLARFLAEQAAAAHSPASESGGPPADFGITEFETLLAEIEQLSDHDARDALRDQVPSDEARR